MQTILVTGGAGFIGSNFIAYYLAKNNNCTIVNLDKLTYAADIKNLREVDNNASYKFIHGDICDKQLLINIFKEYKFKGIIHFAAESHVDNSIENPSEFINTNIVGTHNLLEVAKLFWIDNPETSNKQNRFLHVSTDEVYGSLKETGFFTENTPYAPNSPYSASKAASDFLVRSYHHTFRLNVVTTNCSNNFGPKQHDEKLIPTVIRKALNNEKIPIYGTGKNVRDWLYVEDHCKAIDLVYQNGKSGETYIIGANNEYTNLKIADMVCEILDANLTKEESYKKQISFVEDRLGHDFRYAIDATKIKNELGWKPMQNFKESLEKTVFWYLNKYRN
ncbi:MAG: dTDP-glucose 4,6-dehydratase [Flavobacteriaceae bacterium]|nr:dTDP-glucose 4,6-dehydratase [Flavobacteriaceae bacterium]